MTEFQQAAHTASRLEQLGKFAEAAQYWRDASAFAKKRANTHWCEIREQLCRSAQARKNGRNQGLRC